MKTSPRGTIAIGVMTLTATTLGALLFLACNADAPLRSLTPTDTYYDTLKSNSYIQDPLAKPPARELFSENTKHFGLVPVPSKQSAQLATTMALPADYSLYAPLGAESAIQASPAVEYAVPGAGISGFKPVDIIPTTCAGLSGDGLRQCLDDNNTATAPPPVHISYHDARTLTLLLGTGFNAQLRANLLSAFKAHIDKPTQDAIVARLNGYVAANVSHSSINLMQQDILNPVGYAISQAVITDGSRGDTNKDGLLEAHSTLILEFRKPLNYSRSANAVLDNFIKKYNSSAAPLDERYEATFKAYIHLDHLAPYRQVLPEPPTGFLTNEQELAHYGQRLKAQAINHAFDTNVIAKVLTGGELPPWSCTEYSLSFQLSTDSIGSIYAPILGNATASGDADAVAALETHIDAQTAIITGGSTILNGTQSAPSKIAVMYQVNLPKTRAEVAVANGYDYAMLDSLGRRIAIWDPATRTVVLARSESKAASWANREMPPTSHGKNASDSNRPLPWTKAGACQDDDKDWAYNVSRHRTHRFGRGIQWIITEMLLHNQVGDYKNIHWYQSVWKSGTQVTIKAGTFIFTTYLKMQCGAIAPKSEKIAAEFYLVETVLPYLGNVVGHDMGSGKGWKIGGYSLQGIAFVASFLVEKGATNPTWKGWIARSIGNFVLGFMIDRMGQGFGQMIDVEAVGWQDFSDSSHHGCFRFD